MSELTQETLLERRSCGVVTLDWLRDFARVSGDMNPIHQDVEVAKSMGLPTVIAHGMVAASLLHSRAEQTILEKPMLRGMEILKSNTRFKAMTLLGDELFTLGNWQAHENGFQLDLQAQNQREETVVQTRILLAPKRTRS